MFHANTRRAIATDSLFRKSHEACLVWVEEDDTPVYLTTEQEEEIGGGNGRRLLRVVFLGYACWLVALVLWVRLGGMGR